MDGTSKVVCTTAMVHVSGEQEKGGLLVRFVITAFG